MESGQQPPSNSVASAVPTPVRNVPPGQSQPQSASPAPPPTRPRRILRARAACLRCQRRKIRCDGAMPSCGSCLKAGAKCDDGGKQDGGESPRAYIAALKERIRWLEGIVKTNCPEIDLSQGPPVPAHSGSVQPPASQGTDSTSNETDSSPQSYQYMTPQSDVKHDRQPVVSSDEQPQGLAHEIGLVSLSGGTDPKYIGPSSGYFFAKLVLACAGRQGRGANNQLRSSRDGPTRMQTFSLPRDALHIPPTPLPESIDYTFQLSETYFETIHYQYPFLHQPTHNRLIEHVYSETNPDPIAAFQVNMVLAISATVLSRRLKVPLSGEGFCANAMKYFDQLHIESSLKGLQCVLLLLIYTLHSPSMGLNVWFLNYQCIAALLDLGLQRDVRSGKTFTVLDQEMRTRTFWCIFSLDRTIATIMGRPIGVRDEACELRLPTDCEDSRLTETSLHPRSPGEESTHMTYAIHLFKLSHLNSEMKYVLHSISHQPPPYAYPNIPDILEWQKNMLGRLRQWESHIPRFDKERDYLTKLCEIKYHSIMILLLRPSPAIPKPSPDSLRLCYESATASLRLYDSLYKSNLLVYSWTTVHSIFLSTITMLYCVWTVPEVTAETKLDALMADLKAGSNVLSATGEHWSDAKRSRDVLDEISSTTVRWIIETRARNADTKRAPKSRRISPGTTEYPGPQTSFGDVVMASNGPPMHTQIGAGNPTLDTSPMEVNTLNPYPGFELYTSLFGDVNVEGQFDLTNPVNVNAIMQGVFNDFQPIYDFGQEHDLEHQIGHFG